jgi:hypothetical protein
VRGVGTQRESTVAIHRLSTNALSDAAFLTNCFLCYSLHRNVERFLQDRAGIVALIDHCASAKVTSVGTLTDRTRSYFGSLAWQAARPSGSLKGNSFEVLMANLFWLSKARSRRSRWMGAWVGVVMIAGGIVFLTVRLGDSTRKVAAEKPAVQSSQASEQNK